jgi:hypothetical protein
MSMSLRNITYPVAVGSIAIFPPIMANATLNAPNITHNDVRRTLGNRPRLNLRNKSDKGNNNITDNQTSVNNLDTMGKLAPELA